MADYGKGMKMLMMMMHEKRIYNAFETILGAEMARMMTYKPET